MMRRIDIFRYSRILLQSKMAAAAILLGSLGFFLGFLGITERYKLQQQMILPVKAYMNVDHQNREMQNEIRTLDGVRCFSQYRETTVSVQWQDYTARVILVGMEKEVLEEQYGAVLQSSLDGAMPYLIVEHSALEMLKNEKGEKPERKEAEQFLLEHVKVNTGEGRILGIIPERIDENGSEHPYTEEQVQTDKLAYVYTMLEGYENLAEMEQEERAGYYMEVSDGKRMKQIQEILQSKGIEILTQDETDTEDSWNTEKRESSRHLIVALMGIFCGGMLLKCQGQMWRVEHKAFVDYLEQMDPKKSVIRRMYRYRILWYAAVCLAMAFVINVLSEVCKSI